MMMRTAMILFACAAALTAAPRMRKDLLVSSHWLAGHLRDPRVVVIHVAGDRAHYDAGHIPGARFLAWKDVVTARNGLQNELPGVADIQRTFERLGVRDDSRVILYGDRQGLSAARAFFTLDYIGHQHTALLDGGLEQWRADGRPVSTDEPTAAAGKLHPRPRPEVVVDLDRMRDLSWTAANVPGAGVVLVDARAENIFKQGGIPGSRNVYWMEHFTKGRPILRPVPELRNLYASVPGRAVTVAYCMSGVQASHTYFVLRLLGYDARLYDGSYSEWSAAMKDAPH